MPIHPSAIVSHEAEIDSTADIGPFCVIGADVRIGARTRLFSHVCAEGPLTIGEDNQFYPHSSIGFAPQDLKYHGERSETIIGDRNRIREFVSIHRGTEGGGMITRIGSDNLFMVYVHIAHDVQVGNHTILANSVGLAGHVLIGDWAVMGAFSGVHQFCRIGRHAIVGAYSVITQDVLPFSNSVSVRENKIFGANRVGLERRGFSSESIEALQTTFRLLTRAGLNTTQALERVQAEVPQTPEIEELIAFVQSSQRGFVK